jgi:hypothetical protein
VYSKKSILETIIKFFVDEKIVLFKCLKWLWYVILKFLSKFSKYEAIFCKFMTKYIGSVQYSIVCSGPTSIDKYYTSNKPSIYPGRVIPVYWLWFSPYQSCIAILPISLISCSKTWNRRQAKSYSSPLPFSSYHISLLYLRQHFSIISLHTVNLMGPSWTFVMVLLRGIQLT